MTNTTKTITAAAIAATASAAITYMATTCRPAVDVPTGSDRVTVQVTGNGWTWSGHADTLEGIQPTDSFALLDPETGAQWIISK